MPRLEVAPLDENVLRRAFSCFPSGVVALAALADADPVGMAASAFTAVSLTPPLVAVCVQQSSTTWPTLRTRPHVGVSVLGEGHSEVCLQLSRKNVDRFHNITWTATSMGSIFVHEATAWLDCSIHRELPVGDHTIVVLQIHAIHADPSTEPLVFHGSRFRQLIPMQTPRRPTVNPIQPAR